MVKPQPIETAPMETRVMVFCDGEWWIADCYPKTDGSLYWSRDLPMHSDLNDWCEPTHWLPLPEPIAEGS